MAAPGVVEADQVARAVSPAAAASKSSPDVYTRIGVRPFINATATLTINGGSQMLPEVISTIEQASHYHVNLDELMEKVADRAPARRLVTTEEVGAACVFLASPYAKAMTGETLYIDGGYHILG